MHGFAAKILLTSSICVAEKHCHATLAQTAWPYGGSSLTAPETKTRRAVGRHRDSKPGGIPALLRHETRLIKRLRRVLFEAEVRVSRFNIPSIRAAL